MQNFYRRFLNAQKSGLLNRRKKTKREKLTSALNELKKSYWRNVKNANLNDLFNLGLLTGNRIKLKEFPILLILIIYECVQLTFRNKLPYIVFIIIILQSIIHLKNTTDLFNEHIQFLYFKTIPILSLESILKTKFISFDFMKLFLFNNLIHLSDLHLYISLINFLWKGKIRFKFHYIIIIFISFLALCILIISSS